MLISHCCSARPWMDEPLHERCSECLENCSFLDEDTLEEVEI